ncbi:MAG: 2-succinyl-5-enolpyruvyl-6-hydroxy-3-cyclohexene-1-carboxylic-acid synthase [Pseudonocardiaceae bacterium]|nr:2-succinyl-5-enolpyruvyl-6-hydroxy-3-cyclohexene-1-carboxylic-acid synthase [Pseudonocardiaceae bacterium]
MNPSTALARVLVDELVRCGVHHVVLCPGSRNAPLAFALHEADVARRVALHVRIDERSAAFLALGLALRSGDPVPVVCTSGTAVANLHAAVLEAHHAGVPLLALTADRPPELVGTGANQTVAQPGIFAAAVRAVPALGVPERCAGQQGRWRSTVDRAVAAARGVLEGRPSPVHLNVPLREPLVPESAPDWPEVLHGRPDGQPWTALPAPSPAATAVEVDLSRRTLVIAGDGAHPGPPGVPLVAEPTAGCWPDALAAGPWLLGAPDVPRPEQVLVLGRPTLHRPVGRLLADPDVAVTVVSETPQWTDVPGTAVAAGTALHATGSPEPRWYRAWRDADGAAARAVTAALDGTTGLDVARRMVAALPDGALLVIGSSNPIRDVALAAAPRHGLTVLANRGIAGIDGTVATAVGAALAHRGPSYALLGDLTFLHDANGLLLGPAEARPDLTIVVANDEGGGIFGLLEQGSPEHAAAFERVFGTPHGTDLASLCAAHHVPHAEVTVDGLAGELAPRPGLRVLEVRTARDGLRALHGRIREAVSRAWTT